MALPFADRSEAGRLLAQRLAQAQLPGPLVVVALPRGGVPVGAEVARLLHAPLDLLIVRKIGAPWQRELTVAAVVEGETPEVVVDEEACASTGTSRADVAREAEAELCEIHRRRAVYLRGRTPLDLTGTTTVVVDDGLVTGTTARAALQTLRRRGAKRLVLAVPVAAHAALMALRTQCDRIVCLAEPQPLRALGSHYLDFHRVGDAEVTAALDQAGRLAPTEPEG